MLNPSKFALMSILNMTTDRLWLVILCILMPAIGWGQDLDLLTPDSASNAPTYTRATFKTNRVVLGHSVEMVARRNFDLKINHRFDYLNSGFYDLFGLDRATMRIGGDYGITDNLNVGLGRSTEQKTYDGFAKYRFLRQSDQMPVSAVVIAHIGVNTLKFIGIDDPEFHQRMHYTNQVLIARKFTSGFSAQLTPTHVHMNLVDSMHHSNDVVLVGFGMRQKITARTTVNLEYFLPVHGTLPLDRTHALSLGFDLETGGHIFQLFFTNTFAPFEKGFLVDNTGNWLEGDVRFGFNIARMFSF